MNNNKPKTDSMRWFECPYCKQKLFRMTADAVIKGIEIKCKKCKEIIFVSEPLSL